jgi:hypothetical protein
MRMQFSLERIGFDLPLGSSRPVDDCARNIIFSGTDSFNVGNQMLYHTPEEVLHSSLFLPAGKTHSLKYRHTGRNDLIAGWDLPYSFIELFFRQAIPPGRLSISRPVECCVRIVIYRVMKPQFVDSRRLFQKEMTGSH